MADTLYDIAEQFRQQILTSPEKEKTAAEFFSAHGHAVKEEDVIVLDDGTPVIRDDPGRNFDRHQLQQLKDEISGQLSLFSEEDMPRKVEGRGTARNGEEGSGRLEKYGMYPDDTTPYFVMECPLITHLRQDGMERSSHLGQ